MNLAPNSFYRYLLKLFIWQSRYELAIGNHTGMGLEYKSRLRDDIAKMEGELDRIECDLRANNYLVLRGWSLWASIIATLGILMALASIP